MNNKEIVYLAIPYTWNPDESFKIANKVSAELMNLGYVVFSPISHSHPISDYLDTKLKTNQEFWMNQDIPILKLCNKIIFVVIGDDGIDLIDKSEGCQSEKEEALKFNIPIEFWKYMY